MLGDASGGETDSRVTESPQTSRQTEPQTEPQTPNLADKDNNFISNASKSENQSNSSHSRSLRNWLGRPTKSTGEAARESTPLLQRPVEIVSELAHEGPCNHGTFSPDITSRPASIKSQETADSSRERCFLRSVTTGLTSTSNSKRATTARLAEEHGLKLNKTMYGFRPVSWEPLFSKDYLANFMVTLLT
jgi:hypothetical protein